MGQGVNLTPAVGLASCLDFVFGENAFGAKDESLNLSIPLSWGHKTHGSYLGLIGSVSLKS